MAINRYPSWDPEYRRKKRAKRAGQENATRRTRYAEDDGVQQAARESRQRYRASNAEALRQYDRDRKARSLVHRAKVEIGRCLRCGYDGWPGALQWAHVDRETKAAEPSWLLRAADERVFEELRKCVLVCANCHWEELGGLWAPTEQLRQRTEALLREVIDSRSSTSTPAR